MGEGAGEAGLDGQKAVDVGTETVDAQVESGPCVHKSLVLGLGWELVQG